MFDFLSISTTDLFHGLLAAIVGMGIIRLTRDKNVSETAIALLDPLRERVTVLEVIVDRLEKRLADVEHENGRLWRWGRTNFDKVKDLGGAPLEFSEVH